MVNTIYKIAYYGIEIIKLPVTIWESFWTNLEAGISRGADSLRRSLEIKESRIEPSQYHLFEFLNFLENTGGIDPELVRYVEPILHHPSSWVREKAESVSRSNQRPLTFLQYMELKKEHQPVMSYMDSKRRLNADYESWFGQDSLDGRLRGHGFSSDDLGGRL